MSNHQRNVVSRPRSRSSRRQKGTGEFDSFNPATYGQPVIVQEEIEFSEEEEIKLQREEPAEQPGFPFIMIIVSGLKDILDILDISGIGVIITTPLSVMLAAILFIWTHHRLSGGWWKRKIISWVWIRYAMVVLVEFLPLFKIVPANTIFVLMCHNKETKLVKLVNQAMEELHSANLTKIMR